MTTHELLLAAKAAAPALAWLGSEEKNAAILRMADTIVRETDVILAANEADVQAAKGAISDGVRDQLRLTQARGAAGAGESERPWTRRRSPASSPARASAPCTSTTTRIWRRP